MQSSVRPCLARSMTHKAWISAGQGPGQSLAGLACEERQTVRRPSLSFGMPTVSTILPSCSCSKNFWVPSSETTLWATLERPVVNPASVSCVLREAGSCSRVKGAQVLPSACLIMRDSLFHETALRGELYSKDLSQVSFP